MTKALVPCDAFWSPQSITRIKLSFCCNWTNLLLLFTVFQGTKLTVIGLHGEQNRSAQQVKCVGITMLLFHLVLFL